MLRLPLPALLTLALLPLAACDSGGDDGVPATVAGRWEGTASATLDTVILGARYQGTATDTLTLTLADDAGVLTGTLRVSWLMSVTRTPGGIYPNPLLVGDVSTRTVEGVYGPPFMEIRLPGNTVNPEIDLRVEGDRATGRRQLFFQHPEGGFQITRPGTLTLRRVR
jgi:hypothetical protein